MYSEMKKQIKNTIIYILIATSLAVFFHSFVPHDHHHSSNCDIVHHHQNHDKEKQNPIHCHFFNEIIVDNAITYSYHLAVKFSPLNFALLFDEKIQIENKDYSGLVFREPAFFLDFIVHIQNSPTRGSPMLV